MRAFYKLLYLRFRDSSDQHKNAVQQRFYLQFERYFCMKIIVTIIPTGLVTNSYFSFFYPFLEIQKQASSFEQVGGLVTRNISVLFLQRVTLYFKAMLKIFIKKFSYKLFLFILQFHGEIHKGCNSVTLSNLKN